MIHHPSYFGKLSWSPDFLSFDASGSTMRTLDEWLQNAMRDGRDLFQNGYDAATATSHRLRIVLRPSDDSELVVGSLVPSSDSRGRHYPFYVVYRLGNSDRTALQLARSPILVEPALHSADQIALSAAALVGEPEDLRDLVSDERIELGQGEDLSESVLNCTLGDFTHRAFGGFDNPVRSAFFLNLLSWTASLRSRGVGPTNYAIGFPLNTSPETQVIDVTIWLRLTWWLLGNPSVHPNLIWTSDQSPGRLWLFLGPPTSFVYPFPESATLPDSPIYELDGPVRGNGSILPAFLDDPDTTIGNLTSRSID